MFATESDHPKHRRVKANYVLPETLKTEVARQITEAEILVDLTTKASAYYPEHDELMQRWKKLAAWAEVIVDLPGHGFLPDTFLQQSEHCVPRVRYSICSRCGIYDTP